MKTSSLTRAAILITASIIMLFGLIRCTPLAQYRTRYTPCISAQLPKDCADRAIQEYQPADATEPGYLLGIVEFDDQGQLFSRAQLDAVLGRIEQEASTREFLAVVFVHGWKHNAAEGDDNLNRFRGVLERLSQIETALSGAQGVAPRRVIGIYLGWRGLSITTPLLRELTFWDRKNTAQKVGHGEVTEVLSRLELIRRVKNAQDPSTHNRTRLVVVGHSFGGAVVFTAVGQILESRFLATAGPTGVNSDTEGFGDLVVLINPAFEALMYSPLSDLSTERATYFRSQLPVIAVLTSEKDSATGLWFPLGRWLSTWFEKQRRVSRTNPVTHGKEVIDQRRANVATVGHFEPYRTHYLRATADKPERIAAAATPERVRSYLGAAQHWEDDVPGSRIAFPGSVLERTTSSAGRNPYLVVQVDGKLIPNHNDIWDPRIESFIGHLMEVSAQSADFEERSQRRSRALAAR